MRWLQQRLRDAETRWRDATVAQVAATTVKVRYEGPGGNFAEDVSPYLLRWPPADEDDGPTEDWSRPASSPSRAGTARARTAEAPAEAGAAAAAVAGLRDARRSRWHDLDTRPDQDSATARGPGDHGTRAAAAHAGAPARRRARRAARDGGQFGRRARAERAARPRSRRTSTSPSSPRTGGGASWKDSNRHFRRRVRDGSSTTPSPSSPRIPVSRWRSPARRKPAAPHDRRRATAGRRIVLLLPLSTALSEDLRAATWR